MEDMNNYRLAAIARWNRVWPLTYEQVVEARKMKWEGATYKTIAEHFNITKSLARIVVLGLRKYNQITECLIPASAYPKSKHSKQRKTTKHPHLTYV